MEGRDLIVAARRGAGLTQSQLAERIGRRQPNVSAWERGTVRPSFETVLEVVRACGQDLGVGLPKADDSYDALIRAQLRLGVTERIDSLDLLAGVNIAGTLAELADTGARFVLVGRVAAAAHGWPISLENHDALIEVVPASASEFAAAAERCELASAGDGQWWLDTSHARLVARERPARTAGYADLARDATSLQVDGSPVRVASLIDLIRMVEGDPFSTLRSYISALWRTQEMIRRRAQEKNDASAAGATVPAS